MVPGSEFSARLAVHFFSQLSLSKDYIVDSDSLKKSNKCLKDIKYGNTSIGKDLCVSIVIFLKYNRTRYIVEWCYDSVHLSLHRSSFMPL